MTTLADINQTLMVQNEMQENTTKAVDSLNKRFAAFLRISKGEKLDELEQRREARRENRAMGFARAAGNVAESVKRQTPLLLKILGGAAVAAYILQNKELREAIGGLLSESVKLINETVFQNPEFQRGLKEVGAVIGKAISAAFIAVLPPGLRRFFNDNEIDPSVDPSTFNDKDFENEDQRFPVAATVGALGAAVVAGPVGAKIMGTAYNRAVLEGIIDERIKAQPRAGSAGLDEARDLRKQQRVQQIRLDQANATQQRFSTAQRLTQIQQQPSLLQRTGNFLKGAGKTASTGARIAGQGMRIASRGAAGAIPFLFTPTELADGTIQPEFSIDTALEKIEQGIPLHPIEDKIMMEIDREQLQKMLDKTRFTPRFIMSEEVKQLVDENKRILKALDAYKGSSFSSEPSNYFAPTTGLYGFGTTELSPDYMAYKEAKEMERLINSKLSAQMLKLAEQNLSTTQSAGSAPIIVAPSSTSSTSNVNQRFDLGMPASADTERLTVD